MRKRASHNFASVYFRLIRFIGLIVPLRLRADWRQEWEAELRYRETMLAEWDRLNWQTKLDLWRRSLGALWDALLLQPRRVEDEMFQDLRYGARMLLKNPSFTLIAVITLGLGIGANTAIFSLTNALLFRSPPVPQPDQLVTVSRGDGMGEPLSYPDFVALRERNETLSGLAASHFTELSFGNGSRSEVVRGELVSSDYFDVLRLRSRCSAMASGRAALTATQTSSARRSRSTDSSTLSSASRPPDSTV
jgi:hypothetical protein